MEKKDLDIDTFMNDNHDISPRSSKVDDGNEKNDVQATMTIKAEEGDPTTDYSSKAANKTSMKDYVVQELH